MVIGAHTQAVEIGFRDLQKAEQSIKGSTKSTWVDYKRAILLTKIGKPQLKPLIGDVLPITK